jgi:hypothetical protein|tara:strand:+ start:993 stop:1127 length:135 start_codon:yes stop_codon:yes gene_type:complete
MNNIIEFPKLSENDKLFLEIEKQKEIIEKQKELIEKMIQEKKDV